MAKEKRSLQLNSVQKIANRFSEKYEVDLPVNVRELLEKFAEVKDVDFPLDGVDAVCLFLKDPERKPRVLIKKGSNMLRTRFTEAHELGHIVIPWHIGNVIDDSDYLHAVDERELEANQFAAELLMPSWFVRESIEASTNLAEVHSKISKRCKVSLQAAAIKMLDHLPSNIIFAVSTDGLVEFAGKTVGTHAHPFRKGIKIESVNLAYATECYEATVRGKDVRWWVLPKEITISSEDKRPWREILDEIVNDIDTGETTVQKFKSSVTAVIASANGAVIRSGTHTVGALVARCKQSFVNREDMREFSDHPKFDDFLLSKAEQLVSSAAFKS